MSKNQIIKKLAEPAGQHDSLLISVDYTLGGMNYFTGDRNRRGYKLFLSPATICGGMTQTTLMGDTHESGFYIFLEEVTKRSDKKLVAWQEKIYPLSDKIAEFYSARNYQAIQELVESIK